MGYKTKAAPTNAPAEATSVPTKEPNENGADNAMAALLVLVVGVPVEDVDVDVPVGLVVGVEEEREDRLLEVPLGVEVGTLLELTTKSPRSLVKEANKRTCATYGRHILSVGAGSQPQHRPRYSFVGDIEEQQPGKQLRCKRRSSRSWRKLAKL